VAYRVLQVLPRPFHHLLATLSSLNPFPLSSFLALRFINSKDVVVSYVVSHFYPPDDGFVVFYLNGDEMGRYTQRANEFGEIRTTVQLPELPDGFYDAGISLLRPDDTPTGIEKTVTFQVEASGWDAINAPQQPAPCPLSNAYDTHRHALSSLCFCNNATPLPSLTVFL
jgi:hypothetical protein